MNSPAFENLRDNQHQADMDGVMVTVSRQAVEEVLTEYTTLAQQNAELETKNQTLLDALIHINVRADRGDITPEWVVAVSGAAIEKEATEGEANGHQ